MVEEQVLGKQMRQGFNFGARLRVVFMEHVEDIFRGAYELSQSLSLTLGEEHLRHPKCGTWKRHGACHEDQDLTPAASFTVSDWLPRVKGHFSEKEVGESDRRALPPSLRDSLC